MRLKDLPPILFRAYLTQQPTKPRIAQESCKRAVTCGIRNLLARYHVSLIAEGEPQICDCAVDIIHLSMRAREVVVKHRIGGIFGQTVLEHLFRFLVVAANAVADAKIVHNNSPHVLFKSRLLSLQIESLAIETDGGLVVLLEV